MTKLGQGVRYWGTHHKKDRNSFRDGVVFDIYNMKFMDEDSILDKIYAKRKCSDLYDF